MGASQSTRKITLINDDKAGVIKLSESLAHRLRGQLEGQQAAAAPAVEKGSQETQEPQQDVAAAPSALSLPSAPSPPSVASPEPVLPPQVPLETPTFSKPSIPAVAPDLPADGESPQKSEGISTPHVASASPGLTDSVAAPHDVSASPALIDSKTPEVEPIANTPLQEPNSPEVEPVANTPLQEPNIPEVEPVIEGPLQESKASEIAPVAVASFKEDEPPPEVVPEPAPLESSVPKEEVLPSIDTVPEEATSTPAKAEIKAEVPLISPEPQKEESSVPLELDESKITHDQSGPTDLPNSPVVKIEDESTSKSVVEAAVDAAVGAVAVMVGKLPKEELLKAAFGEEVTQPAKSSLPEEPSAAGKSVGEEPPAAATTATFEVLPPPSPPSEPVITPPPEKGPEQPILVLPPEIEVTSTEVIAPAVVEASPVPSEDVAPVAVSVPAIAESIAEAMVQGSADVTPQTSPTLATSVPAPPAPVPDVGAAIQAGPKPTLTHPSGSIPPWSIYAEEAHLLVMRLREEKEQELQAAEKAWREKLDKREDEFTNIGKLTQEQFSSSLKEVESLFLKATCTPVCQGQQDEVMKCYQDHPKQSLRCSREVAQFTQCIDLSRLQAVMKQHPS